VQGRLAVRTANEGFSSNFLWEHAPERFAIELWGPLGGGRSRLEGDRSRVTLFAADGSVHQERDTTAAVRRWLGVDLPVAALAFWIRGEPAPGVDAGRTEHGASGDLVLLEQLAWTLEFADYGAAAGGRRLPGRIVARHEDVKVTVLPRAWSFDASFAGSRVAADAPSSAGTP
jgi:outer membrane lipoprotein LolB